MFEICAIFSKAHLLDFRLLCVSYAFPLSHELRKINVDVSHELRKITKGCLSSREISWLKQNLKENKIIGCVLVKMTIISSGDAI